jgi:SAM-dependent methyltransferase
MKLKQPVFDDYSRYYDLLYKDKNYASEVDYVHSLLLRQGINLGDLLEFGSGTGKHGSLLAARGYRVHGIERSAEMVARAVASSGFTCQNGDICAVQLERTFDAVLALFHVISYQTSNSNLAAVFIRAAQHLKSGGVFIFDFWYSPAVYAQRPAVRVKRMSDAENELTRIAEPVNHTNDNRVDVNYTIFARNLSSGVVRVTTETHQMRHFSLPEIDLLASTNGFERISAEELLSGKQPGEETWGVCVTLKKI